MADRPNELDLGEVGDTDALELDLPAAQPGPAPPTDDSDSAAPFPPVENRSPAHSAVVRHRRMQTGSARRVHRTDLNEAVRSKVYPAVAAGSARRQPSLETAHGSESFYGALFGAFSYPLAQSAWVMLIIGALFFYGVDMLVAFASSGLFVIGSGLTIGGVMAAYLATFWLQIITHSATGENSLPDWPDLSGISAHALLLFASAIVIAFAPAVAAFVLAGKAAFWGLLALGALLFPMILLANAAHNAIAGINLWLVITSILRTFGSYVGVALVVWALLLTIAGARVVGSLFAGGGFLMQFVAFYFLFVVLRILGLFYRHHDKELGWDCI